MNTLHALPGLLRRPGMLWVLFPLLSVALMPLLLVVETGTPLSALWSATAPFAVRRAVWLLVLLIPAVLGTGMAFARLELQHAHFSWLLPDVRRSLLTGTLLIAVPVAAALALLVAGSAPAAVAVAAFATALFAFSAAGCAFDVAVPRTLRVLLAAAVLLPAARLPVVLPYVERAPWVVAPGMLAAAALLVALQFTTRSARLRHVRWSALAPRAKTLYWAGRHASARTWHRSLAGGRMMPWLRAAEYEGSAGRSLGYPAHHLVVATLAVGLAQLQAQPVLAITIAGIFLTLGRIRLHTTLTYPLARARRAGIAFTGALIDATTLAVSMVAVLFVVRAVDLPPIAWFAEEESSIGWAAAIAMVLAWAPVAQWAGVRWPALVTATRFELRRFVPFLLYGLVAAVAARVLTGLPLPVLAAATATIAVASQLVFRAAVYRHFARGDLL